MYQYDDIDRSIVQSRVDEFREQVERRLSGELTEDQFKPLRLMNGLYLQLHAYMLRVAIPYGTLSSGQLRVLAGIARDYDKGYGHVSTRQNMQFNWPALKDVPDILQRLADAEMHAIQTSGNCIRNVTCDPFAGAAAGEVEDPRVWCEVIRQWSTFHPEFTFLPRKFKIAVTAAEEDRAAIKVHDIGLQLHRNEEGEVGFRVLVGGGLGRTPYVGHVVREFLPKEYLLSYLEAILRVYNVHGRRDNLYKARIKILVNEMGEEAFTAAVEREWEAFRAQGPGGSVDLPEAERARIAGFFQEPEWEADLSSPSGEVPERSGGGGDSPLATSARAESPLRPPAGATSPHRLKGDLFSGPPSAGRGEESTSALTAWARRNVHPHKRPGYAVVTVSLKPNGQPPGDVTADQMDALADLADRYSFSDVRTTHQQNMVLPHVRRADLPAVYEGLVAAGLASPNAGLVSDIIACPGLDYCNLANTRSIPVANRIQERFAAADKQAEIGELNVKISGCINACGHHHVGHIGILGVDKKGEEFYQLTLGGSADEDAAIGKIVGAGLSTAEVVDAVEKVVDLYLSLRTSPDERFIDAYRRLGAEPFKEALYAAA